MSDFPLPPYLQRQIRASESVETRLCDCVRVEQGPDGPHYVPDVTCRQCDGIGSIVVDDPEPLPDWIERMPEDHPARHRSSYIPGMDGP